MNPEMNPERNSMATSDLLPRLLGVALAAAIAAAACGDESTGAGDGGGDGATSSASSASTSSSVASSSSSSATAGGGSGGRVTPPDASEPWDLLSQWNLFLDGPDQVPTERVVPYDVIAPLFSDEAVKLRFIHLPEGATIGYEDEAAWRFPAGAVLVKTFAYPEDARDEGGPLRLMETRLLWRLEGQWKALTYVWNEDGTDAERTSAGDTIPIAWIDAEGDARELDYVVPNTNQCKECHGENEALQTLGGFTLQLDPEIEKLEDLGFFEAAPTPPEERTHLVDPSGDDDLILRGRSYLYANCASCHKASGSAAQSGLHLDWISTRWASGEEGDPATMGVCKNPAAAGGAACGLEVDILTGEPESSVMICRVASDVPEVRMPPLGRQLVDDAGLALLTELIEALPLVDCEDAGTGGSGGGSRGSGGSGGSGGGL